MDESDRMYSLFLHVVSSIINYLSFFTTDHFKRKVCRRPSWKRGIIRKKKEKRCYKKTEEEEDEAEVELEVEPEAEVEAAGPSDSCLTQDEESSSDATGPQPNGHHPHGPSTEEESSNELPAVASADLPDACEAIQGPKPTEEEGPTAKKGESESTEPNHHGDNSLLNADGDSPAKKAGFQPSIETFKPLAAQVQPKHTEALLVSQVGCVNGTESMDSLDSNSLMKSNEADTRTPQSPTEGCKRSEQEEHKEENICKPAQEQHPLDIEALTETLDNDQEKEGMIIFISPQQSL